MNFMEESTNNSKSDEIEWLFENQHDKDFFDRTSNLGWAHRNILEEKLKNNIKIKRINQANYQRENAIKINKIYDKYLFKDCKLLNILKVCSIIQQQLVPIQILSVIILYIGDGKIPISYSLSILPFFGINVKNNKIWWHEIQNTVDHRGIFIPQNIKTAAEEFDSFITERLNRDIEWYKYYNLMVPTINILPINLTNEFYEKVVEETNKENKKDKKYGISLTLPTKGHKEIGGSEMFQRLYLETAFNKHDLDAFYVDLAGVSPSHGDDWCFGGDGFVLMGNGKRKLVSELNVGDKIRSFPNRISSVKCIIVSNINDYIDMVELDKNCWITSEHPILISMINDNLCGLDLDERYKNLNRLDSDKIAKYNLRWSLPTDIGTKKKRFEDKIYNFVLNEYHTINVNGFWCLTLGDGYKGDLIGHTFWSNSKAILTFLKKQPNFPYVVLHR